MAKGEKIKHRSSGSNHQNTQSFNDSHKYQKSNDDKRQTGGSRSNQQDPTVNADIDRNRNKSHPYPSTRHKPSAAKTKQKL